jgi:lipopolysaccharide transport system permease protein
MSTQNVTLYTAQLSPRSEIMRYLNPLAFINSGWAHRKLIQRLVFKEILGRYRGSFLGGLWWIALPLFMLAVYTFVFSVIFQAKWQIPATGKGTFATIFFSGLIVFNFFSESVTRSPSLVLENVSYVKKVVFPLEILAWVTLFVGLTNAFISFSLLMGLYVWVSGPPPLTVLYLPLIILPYSLAVLGLIWFISALGIYIRDLNQIVALLCSVMLFLSPIFYPLEAVPSSFQAVILLSPLTFAIDQVRSVLFWGDAPDFVGLALYSCAAFISAWMGYAWFMVTKRGFADVV